METNVGSVTKIKILTYAAQPLVRFTLTDEKLAAPINCLIHKHSLRFLAEVTDQTKLSVYGFFNHRKQFVVQHYAVSGPTYLQYFYETSPYPAAKPKK